MGIIRILEYGLNRLRTAEVFKVFSFSAIATLVKMITSFISVKFISVVVGPAGIALLGQLNNFSSIVLTLGSGGINNGVTKHVAEYKNDENKLRDYLSTALKITFIFSMLSGILLITLSTFLSRIILSNEHYFYIFIIFGIALIFYSVNNLFISILNGFKEFRKYVLINILGSIFGLIYTLLLVYYWRMNGALISVVTFQSVMLIVTIFLIKKEHWFYKEYFSNKINNTIVKQYLNYTLMSFITAATAPISQLVLRGYIIKNISTTQAGWWEAMNRLSGMYLMIITTSFAVYYLPKFSELKSKQKELQTEIFKAYKIILPLIAVGFVLIYFLRFFVIRVLFTKDFFPMENLFVWQLIGDFFKISSWVLAFLMISQTMTKIYIASEIFFSISLVSLGILLIKLNGIVGITQAYTVNYFIYLIFVLILFRNLLFKRIN